MPSYIPSDTTFDDNVTEPMHVPFGNMRLSDRLLRGLHGNICNFEKPTPLQRRAIRPFTMGGDLVVLAQSGCSRTLIFTIGLLQRMDWTTKACQGLVLSPTRELAVQTEQVISNIGEYLCDGTLCHTFQTGSGPSNPSQQTPIAVGTPQCTLDAVTQGTLDVEQFKIVVLDEADEMLSQGFSEQIYEIFKFLPKDVQVTLFSATMPPEVLDLTQKFMKDPVRVKEPKHCALQYNRHFLVLSDEKDKHKDKLSILLDVHVSRPFKHDVIFCNTVSKAEWLAEAMTVEKIRVSLLHYDMPFGEQRKAVTDFKSGDSAVLISTDDVEHGVDTSVAVVLNYDLPDYQDYASRLGEPENYCRTSRRPVAINFITDHEAKRVADIKSFYSISIEDLPFDFPSYIA